MWKFTQDADEEHQDYLLEGAEGLCSLSPMQRVYGFAAILLAGLVCMFLSLIVFAKPIKFALLFTFGNVMAVGSTALLIGPTQQLRMMFDPVRVYATAIYVGCVVVALICALLDTWVRSGEQKRTRSDLEIPEVVDPRMKRSDPNCTDEQELGAPGVVPA